MDAVKFIKERARMCDSLFGCEGCPANSQENGLGECFVGIKSKYMPEQQIEIVDKWSKEHPRKTRQSVFLEQWPKAPRDNDNLPTACPKHIDVDVDCVICTGGRAHFKDCGDCRREFWMQEVE